MLNVYIIKYTHVETIFRATTMKYVEIVCPQRTNKQQHQQMIVRDVGRLTVSKITIGNVH